MVISNNENYVKVNKESTEGALSILKGTSELQSNNDDVPKGSAQNTNIRFQEENGNVNKAAGVCHLPLQLRFGNIVKSLRLPVFVSDFLNPKVKCIFGMDAGRSFKFCTLL